MAASTGRGPLPPFAKQGSGGPSGRGGRGDTDADPDADPDADVGTDFDGTNFDGPNLDGTDPDGTNLDGTDPDGTNLDGTDFDQTHIGGGGLGSVGPDEIDATARVDTESEDVDDGEPGGGSPGAR